MSQEKTATCVPIRCLPHLWLHCQIIVTFAYQGSIQRTSWVLAFATFHSLHYINYHKAMQLTGYCFLSLWISLRVPSLAKWLWVSTGCHQDKNIAVATWEKKIIIAILQESCDDESLGYRRTLDRPHCVAWTTASCREKLQRSQGAMSGFLSTRECICLDPLQTTLKEMRQRTLNTRSWLPWIQLSHNLVMVSELAEGLEAKAFKHRNANNSGPCSKLQNL